jgi:hypothetical protein
MIEQHTHRQALATLSGQRFDGFAAFGAAYMNAHDTIRDGDVTRARNLSKTRAARAANRNRRRQGK